jgi:hypothetical protein
MEVPIIRRGTGLIAGSPRTGQECDAAAGCTETHGGDDQSAVCDIGIIAGVLDDSGARRSIILARHCQREGRTLATRQRHLDGIGKFTRDQRGKRRLGGGGRAGAGGPAAAKRLLLRGHGPGYRPPGACRHGVSDAPP